MEAGFGPGEDALERTVQDQIQLVARAAGVDPRRVTIRIGPSGRPMRGRLPEAPAD